ncbi:unnamed protein product [Orchesella dallaii]|uniref:Uncharacterized protein n=1 Tax=Orchesella dallaii TaxID=48710 RepID=A0ABP1QW54_9HEXA
MAAEFLPGSSLYFFIGVASVLFAMMLGCFLYHKGKTYFTKPPIKLRRKNGIDGASFRRGTKRNKFLMKTSERADGEEDGMKQGQEDKMRAEVDAKYNKPICWSTVASGEPSLISDNQECDTAIIVDSQ